MAVYQPRAWVQSDFVFGLFVYFRLMAMSLDRAGKDFRLELLEYSRREDVPMPCRVSAAMEASAAWRHDLDWLPTQIVLWPRRIMIWRGEWAYAQRALEYLNHMFDNAGEQSLLFKVELRLLLSNQEVRIGNKLAVRRRIAGQHVGYLNKADHLSSLSFREVVGKKWPES